MRAYNYSLFILSFLFCAIHQECNAQNASRLIRSTYFGYNRDSLAFIEGSHTDYIYNSGSRGLNHYKDFPPESGYSMGELDMDYLYDSVIAYQRAGSIDTVSYISAYLYNSDNFVTSSQNGYFTFIRNSTDRITEMDFNSITGSTVTINRKTNFTYNGNNNVTSELTQDSIGGTTNFRPYIFDTAFYDGGNRIVKHDIYYWYNGVKTLNGRITYTYDAQGRVIHKGNKSINPTGTTAAEYDDSTVYDGAGKMTESFSQTDTFGNFSYHIIYYYNPAGDNDSTITYFVNGGSKYLGNYYTYDNQHRTTKHQFILGSNSTQEEYTYNSFNQKITEINYTGDGITWTPTNRYEYTYQLYTDNISGIAEENADADIILFPNPTHGEMQLKIPETISPNTELRLYDLAGKVVFFTKIIDSGTNINLPDLDKGIYLAVINNNKVAYSTKVVVQ